MDPVILSRWQFALTTIYHFFFVPLTLGLGWLVAILHTMYASSGNPLYKRLTKFWGTLFVINYAMGVVTGIVMEFQFGMNWSEYSRFVGDVFGAPLAIEGLLAFFLESTFIGVWIFGWDRISKKLHAGVMWLIAIGGNLSAFWILIANGFMQHPVGYEIVNGQAQMVNFGALLGNPRGIYLFIHTVSSGLVTGSFFMLGISIYHLTRKREVEAFQKSFSLAAIVGLVSAVLVGVTGHIQGVYLLDVQPMAASASEGHYETANPADFHVIAGFDTTENRVTWSVTIPKGLSLLYFFKPYGEVEGINQIQARYEEEFGPDNYIPNVPLAFWTFRIMVGVGMLMVLVALLALILVYKKFPEKWLGHRSGWLLWVLLLPYVANTAGWLVTETSRQPWVVHGLMLTRDAVSPTVTPGMVHTSVIGFTLIYLILMIIDVYLLVYFSKKGLAAGELESVPIAEEVNTKKRGGKK